MAWQQHHNLPRKTTKTTTINLATGSIRQESLLAFTDDDAPPPLPSAPAAVEERRRTQYKRSGQERKKKRRKDPDKLRVVGSRVRLIAIKRRNWHSEEIPLHN
jgi:hypothetical protein